MLGPKRGAQLLTGSVIEQINSEVEQNLLNNAEIEACDLLIEAEQLDKLLELAKQPKFADMDYGRICLYLLSCMSFMPDPENTKLIKVAKELYLNYGKQIEALRCAMKMNDVGAVSAIFGECKDRTLKMQMAMMLGRQQIFLELPDGEDGLLGELNANSHLHKHFLALARELDIMTPKSPDDVYKMHLEQTRPFTHQAVKTTTTTPFARLCAVCPLRLAKWRPRWSKKCCTFARNTPTKRSAVPDHSLKQSIATMGIAMGEDIGCQMSLRIFSQLTRYGDTAIRRAVPLALALLNTSNPQLTIIETLSKYSHDVDTETARNAIFALGLVGAGTNNARILAILRQLASFHSRDQNTMMLLRITHGLMHLSKGTQTLNPFHSDRQLMCPAIVPFGLVNEWDQ
ncbi:hypothetical protein niasHT_018590 [Heterodera trifolii]|uniref:RPN1 N-terminal domain-containing protein n=1 Tax=Heterodera trifolii TaxID=157864 RepID=A0ABD2LBN9_9BILA